MRFLAITVVMALASTGSLCASDLPTIKLPLPDVTVAEGAAAFAIDLRSYFEVTGIQGLVVQFRTTAGTVNLETFTNAAPVTVSNLLSYVNAGRYGSNIIHRSDQGLHVIQGGGYNLPTLDHVTTYAPIVLEYGLPNTRGTIAMARSAALNSATSEWFINTGDNSANLGPANGGGYAVFGRVTGTGMSVVDAIAALPVYDVSASLGSAFGQLPLFAYSGSGTFYPSNLVTINAAEAVPVFPVQPGQNAVVTFSVTNSTPALATATVSGSLLIIVPAANQTGYADLTVTAADSNGNAVQDAFRLTTTNTPSACTFALYSAGTNFSASGGNASFSVTTSNGCPWAATTNAAWLHTTSSGSGNGTVSYTVDANTNAAFRTGTITVSGQTFTVTQGPAGFAWHNVFGWVFSAGSGWYYHNGFGWMWISPNQWIWSIGLQGWVATMNSTSRTLWSPQFRWLTPSESDPYRADTTAIGAVYLGQYNGTAITDGWVVSDRFGYVWAAGDGVWFYSNTYGWLGVTDAGGIWCVNQGWFL